MHRPDLMSTVIKESRRLYVEVFHSLLQNRSIVPGFHILAIVISLHPSYNRGET
jgi:hypothetical protein